MTHGAGNAEGPVCVNASQYEQGARVLLPEMVYGYYRGGADSEGTLQRNRDAWARRGAPLWPRCCVDVSHCDTATHILGKAVRSPVMVAPTAMQEMCHLRVDKEGNLVHVPPSGGFSGECAMARAALSQGSAFCLSSLATHSIEEVAAACARHDPAEAAPRWFQLYVFRDRSIAADLVQRAADAGFDAICVTVDAPVFGKREEDLRSGMHLPLGLSLENFRKYIVPRSELEKDSASAGKSGISEFVDAQFDSSLQWDDIEELVKTSPLPIVVKGIMRGEEAVEAARRGCAGVVVSNHGGRQLDNAPSTCEVLPEVVSCLRAHPEFQSVEIFVDGGVRRGTDVVKALAMGAQGVLVGRPCLWALCVEGEAGVENVLRILQEEVKIALCLLGCPSIRHLDSSCLWSGAPTAKL